MQPHNFINKNWFRNYPIRGGCTCTTVDGKHLPTDLLVGARVTGTPVELKSAGPFISQLVVKDQVVSVTVSITIGGSPVALWYGSTKVTADNTVIPLQFNSDRLTLLPENNGNLLDHAGGGYVVVGNLQTVKDSGGSYIFSSSAALLELSCLVYTKPPGLRAITVKGTRLSGQIAVDTENVTSSVGTTATGFRWNLGIVDPELVESRQDRTSNRLTCNSNTIQQINTVTPDGAGNIDIFGIEPVQISVTGFGVGLQTTGLNFGTVCPPSNVPNLLESNDYIGSILSVTEPEWKVYWDQYQTD